MECHRDTVDTNSLIHTTYTATLVWQLSSSSSSSSSFNYKIQAAAKHKHSRFTVSINRSRFFNQSQLLQRPSSSKVGPLEKVSNVQEISGKWLGDDEFQTLRPAITKAWRPYVSSWQRGMRSCCRFTERIRSREATSEAGVRWSARYRGAWPCRHTTTASLKVILSGMSSQWSSLWSSVDRPRSNFHVRL